MLREMVKWDYEMKRGDQAGTVVDRALEMACASPQGPVYLSLPREVLGENVGTLESNRAHRARPRPPEAASRDIEQLADWIAAAKNPLIITGMLGRDPRDSVVLARPGRTLRVAGRAIQHALFRAVGQSSDVPGLGARRRC